MDKKLKGKNVNGDEVKMEFFELSKKIDEDIEYKKGQPKSYLYHYAQFKRQETRTDKYETTEEQLDDWGKTFKKA